MLHDWFLKRQQCRCYGCMCLSFTYVALLYVKMRRTEYLFLWDLQLNSTYISTCDIGNYWMTTSGLDFIIYCLRIAACDFDNLQENATSTSEKREEIQSGSIRNGKFALVWDNEAYIETRAFIPWISFACRIQNRENILPAIFNRWFIWKKMGLIRFSDESHSTYWMQCLQLGTRSREYGIGRHHNNIDTNCVLKCLGCEEQSVVTNSR
jgi:hypothetical protein